jgi:hypothetical protein
MLGRWAGATGPVGPKHGERSERSSGGLGAGDRVGGVRSTGVAQHPLPADRRSSTVNSVTPMKQQQSFTRRRLNHGRYAESASRFVGQRGAAEFARQQRGQGRS